MSEAEIELLLRLDYITGCPQSDLEELGIDASKFDVKEKITNLISKYKEQEKIIELMAFELSTEDENYLYRSIDDIIEYFEKKARGENK